MGGLLLAVVVGVAMDPVAAGLTDAASSSAGSSVVATGGTTTVQVTALDMRFSPREVEVPAGDRLVIELTNGDSAVHDLVLASGATSGRLEPGETTTVDAGVVASDTDGWCSVAGHRLMGMTLEIVVTGSAAEAAPPAVEHQHGQASDATDAADDLDPGAEPDADFRAWDAVLAPAALSGVEQSGGTAHTVDGATTHHVTLRAQEAEREVAPGVTQLAWTFNGAVPGPVLRGRVGDTFVVTLVNEGGIGHSLDFHAGALSPDEVMRTIAPGETLTYTFTANRSGIWMYHCSTAPMSLHIASGMFGAVIIDPPGLPAVDHEYLLVQSELYLGPQGGEADAAKVADGDSDLVVFNGYAHQYRHRPLEVLTGDSVRIWVLDAGPNRASAFHVVGGQFSSVYREGDWVLRDGGSTGTGGSQVLALQPAEGGFVELDFPEAGTYPFVTHAMSDAESGASGRFLVTD
ncbi:multicopper oxidase domain-containing protein [Cellulomonas timonensis]|uniref:multicopper oxidase domain-containing protein n=1 Tax=Cellulomonas timonensis TaxID=1689271 RepID=UPI000B3114FD|nr:multicopper oxidase domain-containing protein [Cellulomonas timonensis]